MKIVHCCLSNTYNEGYTYQENLLSVQNKQDGHEVWIVASTEIYKGNKHIGYAEPGSYVNGAGIKVIRVPYIKVINDSVSHKFRAYKGVRSVLDTIGPDLIVFHGIAAWELKSVAKYAAEKGITFYIDNHACLINSGRSWFSKNILHGTFYRYALQKALPAAKKVLCIGTDEYSFARTVYKVPESKLELWPLGGNIQTEEEYRRTRESRRHQLNVDENTIVFMHSGKMNRDKKTKELLQAFSSVRDERFALVIAGEFLEDTEEIQDMLQQDLRIRYLGWKSGEELLELLAAADVYLQPGSMSATMQNAMCSRCAVVVQPTDIYRYFLEDTGVYVQTQAELEQFLLDVSGGKVEISKLRRLHFERAKKMLDYRNIAKRLYKEPKSDGCETKAAALETDNGGRSR